MIKIWPDREHIFQNKLGNTWTALLKKLVLSRLWLLKCCKKRSFCYMLFYCDYILYIYVICFTIYLLYIYMYIICFFNFGCIFLFSYYLILNFCDNVFIFIICTKLLWCKILIIKKIFVFQWLEFFMIYEIFYYMVFTRCYTGKIWSSIIQDIVKPGLHYQINLIRLMKESLLFSIPFVWQIYLMKIIIYMFRTRGVLRTQSNF